jgi:hypothetical protein
MPVEEIAEAFHVPKSGNVSVRKFLTDESSVRGR